MDEVKYFSVTVKLQQEVESDKAGNPKMKKWKEDYLVHAGTSQEADEIVRKEMDGSMAEWRIAAIKEAPYCAVLND